MNTPLHERMQALREFLAPPSANALTPPALDLLDEAIKALTPPKQGERAPSDVAMPWPSLHAGMRLVTGAYPQAVVAEYGNARAAERDAYWQMEIDRLKRVHGAELVEFLGIDPVSITAGAHYPMIPDSWRFGFHQPEGSGLLRFQRMDAGPLVAWDAVAPMLTEAARPARPELPPLDDTLRDILGRICFTIIPLVQVLRAGGMEIPKKAEAEQAAAIHWMLGHYFKHGDGWKAPAMAELDRIAGKVYEEAQADLAPPTESFVITGVEVKTA